MFSSPFKLFKSRKIIHFAHHKMGTVWFSRILSSIVLKYNLKFQKLNENIEDFSMDYDVIFVNHSNLFLDKKLTFKGSHMVRDLRDVVISGYFYHLKTNELWANMPRSDFNGLSYKSYLNSLDINNGLLAEIIHLKKYTIDRKMDLWNYRDSRILELKYEDFIINQKDNFHKLFNHYGFNNEAVRFGMSIVEQNSLDRKSKNDSHIRSGKVGEWKEYFNSEHKELFKRELGDLLIYMGYEKDLNW
jgi:hypothetical protein